MTVLVFAILFSIIKLIWAATPNPGHDWVAIGDGLFTVAGLTAPRTFSFPDASTTVLTTSSLVTVAQGGSGTSSLTGIIIGNGTNALTATTAPSGALVGDSASQTLTNKTLVDTANTITDTAVALGDLLKSNGTKFVRFARGTANQLLRTNAGGTDIEWATINTAPAGSDTWIQYNNSGSFGATSSLAWDQSNTSLNLNGYLQMATSALPSTPTNGSLRLSIRTIAGRDLPYMTTDVGGNRFALQPSIFQNYLVYIGTGSGTTLTFKGTTLTSGTTLSHQAVTEARGYMARCATTTTNPSYCYTSAASALFYRGSTSGINGFFFVGRVATDTTITSLRYFVGLTDQVFSTPFVPLAADNPAGNRAAFQYSTAVDGTTWQFSVKDGTTENKINTGVTVTANHVYDMYIYTPPQGSTIYWRLDDLTADTITEGSTGTNLPTATVAMRVGWGVATVNTTIKYFHMQKLYCEVPR